MKCECGHDKVKHMSLVGVGMVCMTCRCHAYRGATMCVYSDCKSLTTHEVLAYECCDGYYHQTVYLCDEHMKCIDVFGEIIYVEKIDGKEVDD